MQNGDEIMIEQYNKVKIDIDPSFVNIGIQVSGGADSALLLYLISKTLDKWSSSITVYPIHGFDPWRPTIKPARKVVEMVRGYFPRVNIADISSYDASYVWGRDGNELRCKNGWDPDLLDFSIPLSISRMYNGSTLYSHTYNGPGYSPQWRKDPGDWGPGRPMLVINKQEVVQLFREHDIMDLYYSTWSCGAQRYPINLPGNHHEVNGVKYWNNNAVDWDNEENTKPCGVCWACDERRWGELDEGDS